MVRESASLYPVFSRSNGNLNRSDMLQPKYATCPMENDVLVLLVQFLPTFHYRKSSSIIRFR